MSIVFLSMKPYKFGIRLPDDALLIKRTAYIVGIHEVQSFSVADPHRVGMFRFSVQLIQFL
ncbi:hypothetical protein C5167_047338 [Papaver somniferum]|uniref:Uncharacterized protein n=1 Tax=Papaver somniferum TaxID=3469 RepID=A0A4Y7LGC8_PAPSO|nr:hypothetical protein C5167_047338 [Papaver somniferum]